MNHRPNIIKSILLHTDPTKFILNLPTGGTIISLVYE